MRKWLIALTLVLAGCAQANPSYPTATTDLLNWIDTNTDYAIDYADLPTVHYYSDWMMRRKSAQTVTGGRIAALYFEHNSQIWFNTELPMPLDYRVTVLVHELVHHVQAQNNNFKNNCDKEIEAYTLQLKFARQYGIDTTRINPRHGYSYRDQCIAQGRT